VTATREKLRISLLEGQMSVCRLSAASKVPDWASEGGFCSITRTSEELSVVCPEVAVPEGVRCEGGWRVLKLAGPFEFSEVGVLLSVAAPLAEAGVEIFVISTFDTDYVLLREEGLGSAVSALRTWGQEVADGGAGVEVGPTEDEGFLWKMLYEAVHWVPEETGPKPPPEELLADVRLRRYVAGWGRPDDLALVARDAGTGREVGAAWYRVFSEDEPGYGFVDAATPEIVLAVDSDRRGTGVGGTLLRALMEAARAEGFRTVSLSVHKSNRPALRLYEKSGFATLRDDGDDWVMKADLLTPGTDDRAPGVGARQTEET
jgi:ribosomal protein S18 acetylase RimI-like enzyme